MPIRPYLAGFVFDDDTLAAMGIAFDRACRSFGLIDKEGEDTKRVAQKIIEAAQAGERDSNKLYEKVREWGMQRGGTDWPPSVKPIQTRGESR